MSIVAHQDSHVGKAPTKRKRKVLEEEEYIEKIDRIIQRDFFPEIALQNLKKKLIQAHNLGDFDAVRRIEEEIDRKDGKKQKGTLSTGESHEEEESLPRLDQFHREHVSEDNDSFSEIVERDTQLFKEKREWMFKEESSPLLLTAGEASQRRQIAWKYKTENQLMFVPNGIAKTEEDESQIRAAPKSIVYENTRFIEPTIPASALNAQKKNQNKASSSQKASNTFFRDRNDNKKIDLDDLQDESYAKLRGTPPRGNYEFVSTPVIQPGLAGESTQGTSFVTWGTLQSTPQIIAGSRTPDSGYSIPPTPVRELVAKSLVDKVSKKHRSKKGKTASIASKSIEYRRTKSAWSPSASPLISPIGKKSVRTPSRIGSVFGSQLNKSYSSPSARSMRYRTPTMTPKMTPKMSLVSPLIPSSGRASTPASEKTSKPSESITDGLLKL